MPKTSSTEDMLALIDAVARDELTPPGLGGAGSTGSAGGTGSALSPRDRPGQRRRWH